MNWQEVCENPYLQNLPFKIELNERGQILMSPVKVFHSLHQGEIEHILRSMLTNGKSLPECAIKTRKGTKVADVVWISSNRLNLVKHETECSIAPEICVEVLSESNTDGEISEKKRQLYFENGAEEVWICAEDGDMSFYDHEGEMEQSSLVPKFPKTVVI